MSPNVSQRVPTCPNGSQQVPTGPNVSQRVPLELICVCVSKILVWICCIMAFYYNVHLNCMCLTSHTQTVIRSYKATAFIFILFEGVA